MKKLANNQLQIDVSDPAGIRFNPLAGAEALVVEFNLKPGADALKAAQDKAFADMAELKACHV